MKQSIKKYVYSLQNRIRTRNAHRQSPSNACEIYEPAI